MLVVEVAEVGAPEEEFFFGYFFEEAAEAVAQFFSYPHAEEKPVVFTQLRRQYFSCRGFHRPLLLLVLQALGIAGRSRGLRS